MCLALTSALSIIALLLLFPEFVHSILRKSDMLERKILQKLLRKTAREPSPEQPPRRSLRNIRLAGLLCLGIWLALVCLMWTESI